MCGDEGCDISDTHFGEDGTRAGVCGFSSSQCSMLSVESLLG